MSNKEKFIRLVEVLERDKASALRVSDSLPFFQDGDEHFNLYGAIPTPYSSA